MECRFCFSNEVLEKREQNYVIFCFELSQTTLRNVITSLSQTTGTSYAYVGEIKGRGGPWLLVWINEVILSKG